MSFNTYLEKSAKEISLAQGKFIKEWEKKIVRLSPHLLPLGQHFSRTAGGGKFLRGTLVKLGFEIISNHPVPKALFPLAVAYELFHMSILAHDDIIDKSTLRRNKPSLYHSLGGDHYGISQAISLADVGFFLSYQLLIESAIGEKEKLAALTCFGQITQETAYGELLDVLYSTKEQKVTDSDVLTMYRLKTAQYTIVGPLQLGAILAGASEEQKKNMKHFGQHLGIAFQIYDDINDIVTPPHKHNKIRGADSREGKKTILYLLAQKNATRSQRQLLDALYGKGEITGEQLEKIQTLFQETGALDATVKLARQHIVSATHCIPGITNDQKMRQRLLELTAFFTKRG